MFEHINSTIQTVLHSLGFLVVKGTVHRVRQSLAALDKQANEASIKEVAAALKLPLLRSEVEGRRKTSSPKELARKAEKQQRARLQAEQRAREQAAREQAFREAEEKRLADLEATLLEWKGYVAEHKTMSLEQLDALVLRLYQLRDEPKTVRQLLTALGLKGEGRTALLAAYDTRKEEQKAQAAAQAAAKKAQAQWRQSLIPSYQLLPMLGLKKAEYQRWLDDGRLKVAEYREFRKWGQDLKTPMFDPAFVATVGSQQLVAWRDQDAQTKRANRSAAATKAAAKSSVTRKVKQGLRLDDYGTGFTLARGMTRSVTLHCGPTNSGKTHAAMQELAVAKSGLYLAPLRLLALEAYEALKAKGVPVSLMTGEERVVDPAARHVCATIEMCPFEEAVEVAVIDEMQMIADSSRGWAWTAALLGAPAKRVYACGATHAAHAVKELLESYGEVVTLKNFERKNHLSMQAGPIGLHDVREGDAVIAFSRKDVLHFAATLRNRGLRPAVIYGALSPEVRRAQVHKFLSGEAKVVVATDAIGMGINLPIRRVIFAETRKFDGVKMRSLTAAEAQQIAGRAGRYGLHEEGLVTAFGLGGHNELTWLLAQPCSVLPRTFQVQPTWDHVQHVIKELSLGTLVEALEFFTRITFGGQFKQSDLSGLIQKAQQVQSHGLSLRDQFKLSCAPADVEKDGWLLRDAARALSKGKTLGLPRAEFSLSDNKPSAFQLELAEQLSRMIALHAWLGTAFPGLAELDGLPQLRDEVSHFINRALATHTGAEMRKKAKRYGWRDDDRYEFDLDDDDF